MTMQELREMKGLSRVAMAKSLGVTPAAIYHVETGRVKLSPKMAAKVWEVYGVALDIPENTVKAPKRLVPKNVSMRFSPSTTRLAQVSPWVAKEF